MRSLKEDIKTDCSLLPSEAKTHLAQSNVAEVASNMGWLKVWDAGLTTVLLEQSLYYRSSSYYVKQFLQIQWTLIIVNSKGLGKKFTISGGSL